ncbi:FixH family protein [Comamonas antarctica]|uniref:FixH family protein n=1 Tax=Comamonas antarctica TaxID=2743470 RepID=UPI0028E259AD|nr:FixH family protein [Comamonas antarctica]
MTQKTSPAHDPRPWWKFGFVWMVIGGPAVVVVAGVVTFWIAATHPDPVIDPDYYRHGSEINKTLSETPDLRLAPAMTGRNHAATPAELAPVDR